MDRGTRTADRGLWTADCGLRTADCGLRTADCGLRTADCGLRTTDCGLRIVLLSPPSLRTNRKQAISERYFNVSDFQANRSADFNYDYPE